jgi:hypothetical protein
MLKTNCTFVCSGAAPSSSRPVLRLVCSLVAVLMVAIGSLTGTEATRLVRIRPTVAWNEKVRASVTTPTLQVVVNPLLRRGSPIHDRVFQSLQELRPDYARYVPWRPYPRLGVAELRPPTDKQTWWDFSLMDPLFADFMAATAGHPSVIDFSTTPQWMWSTPQPVEFPDDPNQVAWGYEGGTELRDPSGQELADYYARLAGWYTAGGFTDERGEFHASAHRYAIAYWEVLNEIEPEHAIDAKTYTKLYDRIVKAVHRVTPDTKFVGLALGRPRLAADTFEYFLDPNNHEAGTRVDAISYHFYATPTIDQPPEIQQYTIWDQADGFINLARYIDSIKRRLAPETRVMINEVGAISADDIRQREPGHVMKPIPGSYWNMVGAMFAYLYSECANIGVDVIAASQLIGYPTQYPSVSLVDWNTGQPNARFWVLNLLREHFSSGDLLLKTSGAGGLAYAQGFLTKDGRRKLLLVNKRNSTIEAVVPAAVGGMIETVDQETGFQPPQPRKVSNSIISLGGYGVTVITFPAAQ